MDNNNSKKVKRNESAVWRVIDDEIVVLVPEGAMVHALTGCGSRVWELIEGEMAISEIIQKICAEYEVEPQRAEKEITQFVYGLLDNKLVEIVPKAAEEATN